MRSEAPHASRVHEADSLLLPSFGVDHSCFPALARYGVAVAVGTGVGGTPGVGGGGCGAKIPYGSRSRRYISQCSVMFRAGSAVKHTHAHFSGKQRSRCCGFAASIAGVQAAASFSASVIVLPSQSQHPSMPVTGPGVGLGGSVNGSNEAMAG